MKNVGLGCMKVGLGCLVVEVEVDGLLLTFRVLLTLKNYFFKGIINFKKLFFSKKK